MHPPLPGAIRLIALLMTLGTSTTTSAQATRDIDARVEELLSRMNLSEKVGEMTQLTLGAVSKTSGSATVRHELDPAKLYDALVTHNVGSLLNVDNVAFTPTHWHNVIQAVQSMAARKRLKIPVIYGIDAVHGHNYMVGATLFPQNLAMAATWNPELVRRANEITAVEMRASGIPWNFSPVLDLGRQPLWSRLFETFGEDVHLASVLGAAAVRGQQVSEPGGRLLAAATGKHFVGYSMPRTGKDRTPAWIPDRMLYEYFVPPFAAAIDAGLRTVMINSGDINGVPVHASPEILTTLLRDRLGFRGVAVTDWEDIIKLHTVHRVAATQKDAVRMAVDAGIDMSMVPNDLSFHSHLMELVREGAIPESRIDASVRRILKLKFELGLFEDSNPDRRQLSRIATPESQAVSRTAAAEAITLLQNERALLPLSGDAKVLVTGPGATSLPALHGSWTYTWQGTDVAMYPRDAETPLEALRSKLGAERVLYVPGASFTAAIDIDAAVREARVADAALVFLAEEPSTEQPGDIEDLSLPEAQRQLVEAVAATGTPVVVVLLQNRPRIIREIVDDARAILLAYQPGPFGSRAIADVIFGDVNPSGRLPFTYPRFTGSLVHYDRTYSEAERGAWIGGPFRPQWEFGHGRSYTSFDYSALRVDKTDAGMRDTLAISVTVENIGQRAGKEVVQLYVRDLYASIAPPVRRLRAFHKVELRPGERREVTFRLPVSELAFVGLENRFVVEPGEFEVVIGDEVQRFTVIEQ